MTSKTSTCPLCAEARTTGYFDGRHARLSRCPVCDLLFRPVRDRPDRETERAHYLTHENRLDDPGYRRFLDQLAEPLCSRLDAGAEGLDFGSGPGPALAAMLGERGFPTTVWDPLFADAPGVLARRYDFISCTETAEHFHDPAAGFRRMHALLRPGGWLGLMTELWDEDTDLSNWRYLRDPTHVCFYSRATLDWLGRVYGWEVEILSKRVVLFRKPADQASGGT